MGYLTQSFKNMVLKPTIALLLLAATYTSMEKTTSYRTIENAQFVNKNYEFIGPDEAGAGAYANAKFQKGDSTWTEEIPTGFITSDPAEVYDDLKKGQSYTLTIKKGPFFEGERLVKVEQVDLEPVTDLNNL